MRRGVRIVLMVHPLDEHQRGRKRDAQNERRGKFNAVVRVKLQLGQQVARGDAHEHPGRECQRGANEPVLIASENFFDSLKQQHAGGNRQREYAVDKVPQTVGATGYGQQRAERHGVERLVQQNDQKHGQPGPSSSGLLRLGRDAGREGRAVEHTVQCEPDQGRRPTKTGRRIGMLNMVVVQVLEMRMLVMPSLVVRVVVLRLGGVWGIVMVKLKDTFDEEHRQKAGQQPSDRRIDRAEFQAGVRQ